ncbi:MAG: 6-carboxytetrahydropterin synthase [Candidatus Hinthialibacter antarcticus]|nr:6-carboxytetrahydropterin synthase [Candidatus Hinthialibacter antarcticus]
MPIEITRRAYFCAAHRLHSPHLSEDENRETYGACNNPHGHGHNYCFDVTVMGEVDPKTGMLINLDVLDELIEREIIVPVDHHNLNVDVEIMRGVIPTMENMLMVFWKQLEPHMPANVSLKQVALRESEKNSAVYTGPRSVTG